MDKPMKFLITVEVTVNSSDGTRQDALSHLEQMIAWHGLAGIQMAALEPVSALIQRTDSQFTLTNDQAEIAAQASL